MKYASTERPAPGLDERTRDRVARLLLEEGPATAAALGQRLGLSPAAIRRHLDALLAAGSITTRQARQYGARGRGRPAKMFAISESGRAGFPHAYDDIALNALHFLQASGGEEAVAAFARARVAEWEQRLQVAVEQAPPDQRADVLAQALSADGYAASATSKPTGAQLCQHHCPVQHVAEAFPQLCEAETAAFGRLLGTHVQRLATIAHGDGVCTTHIPSTTATAARTSS
ncbi:MAG: helix-turn-helix domain-containing protein [Actinomycetota bacterium]|nr:helix-turn-helix domain-containing protein [Actinomycetota bacterium]